SAEERTQIDASLVSFGFVEGEEIGAALCARDARLSPKDVRAGTGAACGCGGSPAARCHERGTTIGRPRHRLTPEDVGAEAATGRGRTTRRGHERATTIGGPLHRLRPEDVRAGTRGLYDRHLRCIDFPRYGLQFAIQLLVLLEELLVRRLQLLEPLLDRHRS